MVSSHFHLLRVGAGCTTQNPRKTIAVATDPLYFYPQIILKSLKIKAALFDTIIDYMKKNNLTQQQTADVMGVQRSRIGDICRGNITGFSIDSLVAMTARQGLDPLQVA